MDQMQAKNLKKVKIKASSIIFILIVISLLLRLFCFSAVIVKGISMYPTLEDGQIVFVNKLAYVFNEPCVGDIIIAVEPLENKKVIKRITGIPGSTIIYRGEKICLAQNEYFIEGDNENSIDSTVYGPINSDRLIGKVYKI